MNVTIIGGGTAGWIAAYVLNKNDNIKQISLIENSNIPIIGTGEGSTYILHPLIKELGEKNFLETTSSKHKLGIQYRDWIAKGENYNAPLDSPIHNFDQDIEVFKEIASKNEALENYYINANLMDRNIVTEDIFRYSYHFDGVEIGTFFKDVLKSSSKLKIVNDEIDNVITENGKIISLHSKTNTYVSEFYIDCTGFKRLLNNYVKHDWISANNYLPVDTAIPFQLPTNKNTYTVAQAMDSGWMWQISKKNNTGCGYNFCSDYSSVEQAIDEVNNLLDTKIDPIKVINYNSGYIKNPMGKNYCSLGISSNFFEPLEATSIHTTIQMAQWLSDCIDKKIDRTKFNNMSETMMNDFRDFIMFHYRTHRQDTPFWQSEFNRTNIPSKLQEQIKIFQSGSLECLYDYLSIYWWFPPAYNLGFIKNINHFKKFQTRLGKIVENKHK